MARGAALALVVFAIVGGLLWLYLTKAFTIRDLGREVAELEARKAKLLAELERLSYFLAHANDREMLELQARERLLYGYPGEVLILFGE
ncbi:MAG: hypothetical protein GXO72_02125 [Caldiserica bacterium]|nr:hypothetical protein [Caldisericota bacterium]